MKVLVTGSAGFIGFHMVERLMKAGNIEVVGIDNINNYYDPGLKFGRLRESGIDPEAAESGKPVQSNKYQGYYFIKQDIRDREQILSLFEKHRFDIVIHLAA